MSEIRLRFPPSPTGYLHIGGARTAIFNWLYAKKHNGKLILRIEDTDAERSTQESIQGIIEGLEWLGIGWDEGPYFQTEFAAEHADAAKKLLNEGHAYRCFCTKEELDAKREAAIKAKKDQGYDGTCRNLSPEQIEEKLSAGIPYVVRFKTPRDGSRLGYDDKVLGRIEKGCDEIEDFVIMRSNGKPLYLLCNVVDDIRDRISHIIRGQDHMTNTIKQVLLYKALGADPPIFAHMPLTLDANKAKISKRKHGEIVAVQFYRDNGFIPWALVNFLTLLGWSSGDDQEIFSKEELIQAFSLERINKSNSVFNYRKGDPKFFTDPKALSINAHYLREMPIAEIAVLVRDDFIEQGIWKKEWEEEGKEWFLSTLDMIRARFHTLKDFAREGRAYFADDYEFDPKALKKHLFKNEGLKEWLPLLAERFEKLDQWTLENTEAISRDLAQELDVKPGVIINGIRAVVTGQVKGPGLFDILITIGKEKTVSRLGMTGELFEKQN